MHLGQQCDLLPLAMKPVPPTTFSRATAHLNIVGEQDQECSFVGVSPTVVGGGEDGGYQRKREQLLSIVGVAISNPLSYRAEEREMTSIPA